MIKILGYDYELRYSPADVDGGMEHAGRCHSLKQVIILDPSVHAQAQESTVLHEIIEALNYHFGMRLEHEAIMTLETGLYQVFRDNGIDISVLLGGLNKPKPVDSKSVKSV